MGVFIHSGKSDFEVARRSKYVDKSMLIAYVNGVLGADNKFMCVSRARRFGKSLAAKMLCAYYDQSCDSHDLFDDLKIAKDPSYEQHINKYPVISVDVSGFMADPTVDKKRVVHELSAALGQELMETYPEVGLSETEKLPNKLLKVVEHTQKQFIMIVDEWDAVLREMTDEDVKREYVDWLHSLFKSGVTERVFAGVYMTGILPIKQYKTQSALNNFEEFSMINPGPLAGYFGFTKQEVAALAKEHKMDAEEIKAWYDGYQIGTLEEIYNPYSVMRAVQRQSIESYWAATSTYEGLKDYITMNFEGLRDSVEALLVGQEERVNVGRFANDMHVVNSRDGVLTLLIHLGYLSYNREKRTCRIPNQEVRQEFESTVQETGWEFFAEAVRNSEQLLEDTLAGNAEAVAAAIEKLHDERTAVLQYNNENALSYLVQAAYESALRFYTFKRELPMGKGFADLVMVPRRHVHKPAIVVELKFDKSVRAAISQIKEKGYAESLKEYAGEVVLVGINYDKKTKKHECVIERLSDKFVLSSDEPVLSQDKNVLSLLRICPKLNSKQGNKALAVLRVVGEGEISVADLMKRVGGTNRSRFKAQLIDPFVEALLIAPTIPDKPNSSKQRYYLTEKGLALLAELTKE